MSGSLEDVVFSNINSTTWIKLSTWACIEIILNQFTTYNAVNVVGGDIYPVLISKPVFTYNENFIPPAIDGDMLVALDTGSASELPSITGTAIIVTQSLSFIDQIKNNFRLNPLVVLLQYDECEVFVWLPYNKPGSCKIVRLQKMDSCDQISMHRVKSTEVAGCPLSVSLNRCPIFVELEGGIHGAEIEILKDLTKYKEMTFVPYIHNMTKMLWYYTKYDSNGDLSGVWSILNEKLVDIGASCQSLGDDKLPFNFLPCHLDDATTWHLPTPSRQIVSYGFVTALPTEIWYALGLLFLVTVPLCYAALHFKSFGACFTWTILRFLAMPCESLTNTILFNVFSLLLEMCFLVITSIYRSFILYNLFMRPVLQLKSGEEGAEHGLDAYMRERDAEFLNNSYNSRMRQLLSGTGQLHVEQSYNFELLVVNKSAMIMARTILDQAQIRRKYPNIPYSSAVYVDKNTFLTNRVAFLMPNQHPLTEVLSVKLLEIIQAGLPELYLERTLASLPGAGFYTVENQQRPLGIAELASVFYLWVLNVMLCLVVKTVEIVILKKTGIGTGPSGSSHTIHSSARQSLQHSAGFTPPRQSFISVHSSSQAD